LNEPAQVARKYIRQNYGELLGVGEPELNKETGRYEAELLSNYPRIIRDERNPQRPWIKYILLRNLGKIELDKNLKVVSATSNVELSELVADRLSVFMQRAESIMVKASSLQFARLNDVQHVLYPVLKVINNLYSKTSEVTEITLADLKGENPDFFRYLTLLEEAGIIEKTDSGYTSGETFISLLTEKKSDFDSLRDAVLSHLIRTKYPALRGAIGITQLERHIRVDNSYYWQALEAEDPFRAKEESLRENYIAYYGHMISVISFRSTLVDLMRVDAIRQDDTKWYANEQILQDMISMKTELAHDTNRLA
jgi:hypothetical protein